MSEKKQEIMLMKNMIPAIGPDMCVVFSRAYETNRSCSCSD
jgi:hypothetical protein